MSEEQKPSLSVLLADYEAELYETLQQIQALPKNTVLAKEVETYVKDLVGAVKILRCLVAEKWEQMTKIVNTEYINEDDKDRIVMSKRMLANNLAGDILHLAEIRKPCKVGAKSYSEPEFGYEIWLRDSTYICVKAKHLSLPQPTTKLQKVALKDGNVAWLTKATIEKVQSMLKSETEENASVAEK